jgi:hypothetical protein
MKKRIPIVLETDRKDYDLAIENMISEGGPIRLLAEDEDDKEMDLKKSMKDDTKKEKPLH